MNAANSPMAVGSPRSAAPEPTGPSRGAARVPALLPGGGLASQGRLPLAFMGLGLSWLIAATALTAARPDLLALPHIHPHVIALTHAWVLGFFTTVACGAAYQLAPVALGANLGSERRGWWHFGLHATGVPIMVCAFWQWDLKLLGHAGVLVAIGIVLFAENIWRTVRRSGCRDAVAWSLTLAAGWLLLTVLAGLTLAANRFWNFIPASPLALLRGHAHLGLIGFFATLLQGVTFKLVPMFTLGEVRDWGPVKAGLWLSQIGLLGLIPALILGASAVTTVFAGLILLGFTCSGWSLARVLRSRKKRRLDPGLRAFLCGMMGLEVAGLVGLTLTWPGTPWGSALGGLNAMTYAILVFAGGLMPVVAGMMVKIVPFLTWLQAYGPRVGREPTPPAVSLTHPKMESWAMLLGGAALILLLAGAWMLNETVLRAGAWFLAAGAALFVIDMAGVLRHLWRPQRPEGRR